MIVLKIFAMGQRDWKYSETALELSMSPSEVHSGVKRLVKCALVTEFSMEITGVVQKSYLPDIKALKEFLRYGIRHVFPAVYTEPSRGIPTSYGVKHLFDGYEKEYEIMPVWEYDAGEYTGVGLKPLYRTCAQAAVKDFTLYELLALTDALRSDNKSIRDFAWGKTNMFLGE